MAERTVDEFFWEVVSAPKISLDKEEVPSVLSQYVIYQQWMDYEHEWGLKVSGYSLHLSMEDRTYYIANYWESIPYKDRSNHPTPSSEPSKIKIEESMYQKLLEAKEKGELGIRFYDNPFPGLKG